MKGSTKRFFSIILSALLFVAAIAVYSTFVVPEYERINTLRGQYAGKQQALDNQRLIIGKVNDLLTQYRSIPDLARILSLLLPTTESVSTIFQQIYGISTESGLSIQQFGVNTNVAVQSNPNATELLKGLGTVQVSLNLVGPYRGVKEFLTLLEKNIRLMDVVTLKVQPVGQANQDLYFFNLVINSYYQTN